VRLNNIQIITRSNRYEALSNLYKSLNSLKLDDIYRFELAKYMFQLHNHSLPNIFSTCFEKISSVHNYKMRQVKKAV